MINKPKNWENVQAAAERRKLPAGGYLVKIVGAKVATYSTQMGGTIEKLEIALDIVDGEYKGFYNDDYKAQTQEDKKWKGVLRQYLPKDDGTEKDEWTKSALKALTDAIEESNPGYHWDWDEGKLKGKLVGCLFQNQQWEMNGRSGWKAQPFRFISADKIRSGKFEVPADKPLKGMKAAAAESFPQVEEDDGDLPF